MNCEQASRLIDALHDEELDVVQQVEVESHVRGCTVCSTRLETAAALGATIRAAAPRYEPPPELLRRLAAIEAPSAERAVARSSRRWQWGGLAAAAILLLVVGIAIGVTQSGRGGADALARDVVAAHVRSLMANHLVDVESSDRHTVKPWFEGKLDFAPPVKDLAAEGFPLIGGRLDYIAGGPAAALVYRRNRHTINLFISRAPDARAVDLHRPTQPSGYAVVEWQQDGLSFCAVGTLNVDDLTTFANEFRQAPAMPPR